MAQNIEVLLQTNNSADELFTQSVELNARMQEIFNRRQDNPDYQTPLATLDDIKQSHYVFISREFMPFCNIAFTYAKAQVGPNEAGFSKTLTFNIPGTGNFIGDGFFHVILSGLASADAGLPDTVQRDQVRYCKLPGVRLIEKVQLLFNGAVVTEYDKYNMIHYIYNELDPSKRSVFKRMVGNEIIYKGELEPQPGFYSYKKIRKYAMGAQTFKVSHDTLELIIPSIVWGNLNAHQSFLNRNISRIQMRIELCDKDTLIEQSLVGSGGNIVYPTIDTIDYYYKDIYVNREIHEAYIKTKNYDVISTWRNIHKSLQTSSGSVNINAKDWPIQRLYLSLKPDINETYSQHWYKDWVFTPTNIPEFDSRQDPTDPTNYIVDTKQVPVYVESPSFNSLTIRTFSIKYYDSLPDKFFEFYPGGIDYNEKLYAGKTGSASVHFDMKPGYKDIISGFSSTSNNTDFAIDYTSSYFGISTQGTMRISVRVIDTILIDVKLYELRFNS